MKRNDLNSHQNINATPSLTTVENALDLLDVYVQQFFGINVQAVESSVSRTKEVLMLTF